MEGQIDDLLAEIKDRVARNERALVTTLTKKMAEDLTDYLLERGIKVEYLHSDVDTLRRVELLRELREGKIDVIVGINLLREGLDPLSAFRYPVPSNVWVSTSSLASMSLTSLIFLMSGFGSMPCSLL